MPILESAKKYIKVTEKKTSANKKRKNDMKSAVRQVADAIKEGSQEKAKSNFLTAQKFIDKAAKKGVIKKNTAARRKSSLSRKIKQM
ncbi:MAG: 30S ribosomal protein S20 [Candidatus Moranbacteria bacterium]|nr:30S ribosomal protein S20 [Candidatus Moranbacteria bacterium]